MSTEERRKILQMVADGKITAEEAATLMRTLEESAEEEIEVIETRPGTGSGGSDAAEFDQVRRAGDALRHDSALGRSHPHSVERVVDVFHSAKCWFEFLVLLYEHASFIRCPVDCVGGEE